MRACQQLAVAPTGEREARDQSEKKIEEVEARYPSEQRRRGGQRATKKKKERRMSSPDTQSFALSFAISSA